MPGLKLKSVIFVAALLFQGQDAQANVTNSANSLVIDNIVCEGNESTDCDFITKKYYQQSGDVLDPNEVADARLRLGTLIQFRSVDIRLKKGHKRGHVVVVFDVTEASNIQYEWATGLTFGHNDYNNCHAVWRWLDEPFEQCDVVSNTTQRADFNGTITDFNFLGSGKRLSLGLTANAGKNDYSASSTFPGQRPDNYTTDVTTNSDSYSYGISLDYYDPHLFDSTHYFGRARVSYSRAEGDSHSSYTTLEQGTKERKYSFDDISVPYQLEFGRRFASYSFVSFDINKFSLESTTSASTNIIFGINYGWDSRDDILFATKGSVFNSRYFHRAPGDNYGFSVDYGSYHSLWYNHVLSWGINARIAKNQGLFYDTPTALADKSSVSYGGKIRFTSITDIDQFEGVYSGWYAEFNATRENDHPPGFPNLPINLNFGYIYQTSSMVFRFYVGLQTTEEL